MGSQQTGLAGARRPSMIEQGRLFVEAADAVWCVTTSFDLEASKFDRQPALIDEISWFLYPSWVHAPLRRAAI